MDFVNKVGDSVNKMANSIVKGTNKMVEATKLSMTVSGYEDELKDLYMQIGKRVCASYTEGIEMPDFQPEIQRISQLTGDIAELKSKILDLKNKRKCVYCGAEISKSDLFCKSCGSKID